VNPTPVDIVFTLPGVHVLTQIPMFTGWVCEECYRYWRTFDEAMAEKCDPL
jgi:hypothetical protein